MIKFLRLFFPAILLVLLAHLSASAQNCTINAGADRAICPGSAFVLNGNATGLVSQQATWTQVSGQPVTVSATTVSGGAATATVTGYTVGQSYTFRLSATCTDGSPVFDDAVYTVSPLTVANAGPDIAACPGPNAVTMAANAPQAGETGVWSVSGNLPLPTPVTSPNGTITLPATGNTVGVSVYTWTITNSSGSCSSSSSVKVTNLGGEPIAVVSPVNVSCYSVTASVGLHASFGGVGNGQIGTWSFISGPSTPGLGDIHDQNMGISNLIGGTYVMRWTVTGPCFSGSKDVTINVSPPSQDVTNAGGEPFFTYCDGRTVTALNGVKPLYRNEVVSWVSASTNPAGVVISNPTSPTTTISGLDGSSAYDLIYTITNTVTNCSSVAIYHIRYTTPPFVGFATPNPSYLACNASQLTVHYTVSGGNRSQWALVSAPPGSQLEANAHINSFTTAADDFQPIVGMNKIGTYVIRFRRYSDIATGGCDDAFADITIVVSKSPYQAIAGTPQFLACNTNTATLAGNAPQGDDSGIGHWSQVSGPNTATIADKSLNTTGISNLISGVYTFRWIVTGGGTNCGDSQSDVNVVVASAPTHVNAGPDVSVCYATPLKLAADPPAANEKGTWSVVSESPATPASTITFSNVNDPNAIVNGLLANKVYTLQWKIENTCGSITDNMVINTNGTNGPKQANAGPDQCLGASSTIFNLAANAPDAGETGIWTLLPGSPNTPAFTNASNQTVTGATVGTYKFEWQLSKGGCSTTRDTVVITISAGTTVAAINGSTGTSAQDICGLGPVTLTSTNAALASGEVGTWTQTAGAGGAVITSPNGTSTTITGLGEGRYTFRYTITNSACSSSFAEVNLNLSQPPTPAVAAVSGTNPIILCDATSTVLDANTITVGTGLWVVQSGPNAPTFSSLSDPHATISGLQLGTYVLMWKSTNGTICPASTSTVTIIVHQSANAGADQALCNTATTILSGNEGSDGVWTLVSTSPAGAPPLTITKNGSPSGFGNTAIVTGLLPNTNYIFRYTINTGIVAGKDAGGCSTLTDDMTVAVSGPPSTADAGPDQQICTSNTTAVTLAAAVPTVGTGSWDVISRPNGSVLTLSSTTDPHATLSNLSVQGDYLLQWTVSNANCTGTESSNDIVRISVYNPPTTAAPMTDQPAACLSTITLTGTTPTVGIGTWTFVPNGPGDTRAPVIDAPNAPTTAVTGLVVDPANPYKFRWTITNGICNASSADVNITIKDNTPATANAGTVANTCATSPGGTASVNLASSNTALTGNDQGTWTVVSQPPFSPAVTFNNVHSATAIASNLSAGAYTLRWTIANNSQCTSTSDVSFTIYNPPSTADAGPPAANYCLSAPAVLSATAPTIGIGTWTVISKPIGAADPVFSSVNDNHASVTGLVAGVYTFRWTVSTGQCTDSQDNITITVANCVIDLGITNNDGKTTYLPGSTNTYTIIASNNGTSDANGSTITFPFPTGITGSWTATYAGGASGTATGTTSINEIVNLPVGGSVTYIVTAAVANTVTGNLTTTATIAPPPGLTDSAPGNNTATDVDAQITQLDLNITNTDGKTTYTAGTTNTYTIVASNAGVNDANGATVAFPFPTGVTGTWTATYIGGANGAASGTGSINEVVNLPVGSTVTYVVTAAISNSLSGNLNTTATVTLPSGFTDPTPANNTATDVDTQNTQVDLSITNTDGKATYTPGTSNTYTIIAGNNGLINASGATVTFPFPTGVTGSWTATYTGGASGSASGNTSINEIVNLPVGGTVTYTVTALIGSGVNGNLTTNATIAPPAGLTDPTSANNTAADVDTQNSLVDLGITNTDGKTTYTPGTTNTYTVVATNTGLSTVTGALVTYPLPTGVIGTWTAIYAGGATGNPSGTGNINETVTIPPNGTVTYTVSAAIPAGFTGDVTTTATITPPTGLTDPTPANNTATDTDTQSSIADLSVTNSDGKPSYTPGTNNTYAIVVTNNGPGNVTGATVTNALPAGVTGTWTAVYAGGATGAASGTGNIGQLVNMPAGSAVTYTYVVAVPADFTAASITNTTTVTTPAGVTDPTPANNTATDADTRNSITDLKVVKTASGLTPSIGTQVTFTITASNNGPSVASNVNVADLLPSGFAYVSATPSTGAYNNTSGVWAIGTLAPAANVTLTVTARVNASGSYTNTATISGTETDSDPANNNSQVTITPKQLPVANNDAASTGSNTAVTINLLNNDVKATDNLVPGTVTIITPPQHGTVTVDPATGIATYTPAPGYAGTDTFTYTVSDANGGTSNIATATITVNQAPVANNDSAVTAVNTPVTINLPTNDVANGAPLIPSTIAIVQQPLHGTVTVNPTTGVATYTPNAGYFGQDNFTYTIKDQNGSVSNIANVTVLIPQGPTAVDDNVVTTPNKPVGIPVINNDKVGSTNLDPATLTIISQPAHGTLIVDPVTGLVTYTPAQNYAGPDQFTYTIKDQSGAVSNVATVIININDKPVIGLAKAAQSAVKATNGTYDVTYVLTVGNYGITDLNNISIKDNLSSTFSGEQWQVKSIRTLGRLTVNSGFNGNSNQEMLASGNSLFVGQVEEIELIVNVTILSSGNNYLNRATASGTSITGATTTDQSTDGYKPDATTAGDVSPSVPTPVELKRPNEFIPQGFSPNGDGAHDTFVIENTSGRKVNLEVYNRWGNLVFRNTDYKNDWGGKCNQGIHIGDDLPEGTYYYIVKFDDKDRYVGYITLNR